MFILESSILGFLCKPHVTIIVAAPSERRGCSNKTLESDLILNLASCDDVKDLKNIKFQFSHGDTPSG